VTTSDRPIRFGIMCNGPVLSAWMAKCVEELLRLPDVTPAVLIVPEDQAAGVQRLRKLRRDRFLFQIYQELLRPSAMRPVDMTTQLGKVPTLRCRVKTKGKFSEYFEDSDIRRIRENDLDFILRFAFGIVRGEILRAARYGLWSFHHDDEMKYRGMPPGFWEIYLGDRVNGAILQRLTDRLDGGIVLRKGYFPTILQSWRRNLDQLHFGSAGWPASVCKDIREGHAGYIDQPPTKSTAPVFTAPTNLQMIRFWGKESRHAIRRGSRALLRHEEWCIGVVDRPIASFLQPQPHLPVRWLQTPGDGRFIADPFGAEVDGTAHIVYEDFLYRTTKGVIATVEASAAGPPAKPKVALDLPVHASYPYLFANNGDILCVPETHHAREVNLYRAVEFPTEWDKIATILKGPAALDNTIFRHEGRWWLMNTDLDAGQYVNLYVYHARDLEGPWEPHALNPVKSDVRSSRPGGTPFVHDGDLYRPAQDCTRTYGGGITVNRILRLTPTEFAEEPAAVIQPLADSPFPDGIHTISAVGDMTLIDAKRHRFIPSAIPYNLGYDRSGGGS